MRANSSERSTGGRHAIAWVCGIAAVGVATLLVAPPRAQACGGLFCDRVPPDPFSPLPVAQNGENVVFAIDKDPQGGSPKMTAHIQILYTGEAAQFSWIVPVDAAPSIEVGTDQLFASLSTATQPQFQTSYATEGQCIPDRCVNCDATGTKGGGGPMNGSADAGIVSVPGASPGVNVAFQGAVGPYDAAVIQSSDPTALKTWLTTNGYVVSDNASAIIDAYVHDNKFFVAVKLMNGVGVKSIQPVVLKFYGAEPCVPLRLTAIAANPDMPVRIWVLGDGRVVPKNFLEVKVDEALIDWTSGGANYAPLTGSLLSKAADEVGGTAFVTEYAGPSSIAQGLLWTAQRFDLTALQAAQTPPAYVQALIGLGIAGNAQVLPLLQMYIPMPAAVRAMGVPDAQFYSTIATYWAQYAFPAYDLVTLTSKLQSTVIEPLRMAQAMIDTHPYMTRMNTFISPEEMTKDALFFASSGLGDVPLLHRATFRTMCGNMQFMSCNAPVRLELGDGRMAWVRTGSTSSSCQYRSYDLTGLQKNLPASEMAWQRDGIGEGVVVVDNTAMIQAGLAKNNSAFPAEQNMFPVPTTGGGPMVVTTGSGGGCACGLARGAASGAGALAAAALAGVAALRRRRARRPR